MICKFTINHKINLIKNTFDMANASMYHQKEDSPWGFEVVVSNILILNSNNRAPFLIF